MDQVISDQITQPRRKVAVEYGKIDPWYKRVDWFGIFILLGSGMLVLCGLTFLIWDASEHAVWYHHAAGVISTVAYFLTGIFFGAAWYTSELQKPKRRSKGVR